LLAAKDDQIKTIATFLHDDAKVDFIAPAHCMGEPAFGILKESFGDKYVYGGLGSTVVVGEKVTVKAEAGEPVKYAMDADDYRSYREAIAAGPYRALLGGRGRVAAAAQ
jgi:7,8-dihydropterin-6-yl-methyl-4-(beta-D-ribofuranosyl)aminobenzene 5'-phosphate synthase